MTRFCIKGSVHWIGLPYCIQVLNWVPLWAHLFDCHALLVISNQALVVSRAEMEARADGLLVGSYSTAVNQLG